MTHRKKGFTLAEVLITLVVLGIIAAVTIPTLRNSLDDKKYRVPLKKTYSVLSEAFDQTFHFSDIDSYFSADNAIMASYMHKLANKLALSKVCCADGKTLGNDDCFWGTGSAINECFPQPKSSDGKDYNGDIFASSHSKWPRSSFVLKDGTSVTIKGYHSGYVNQYGINSDFRKGLIVGDKDQYLLVFVDINGKTGPNTLGKDIHAFVYTQSHGLLPSGVDATGDTSWNDCSSTFWANCTYDYLMDEE